MQAVSIELGPLHKSISGELTIVYYDDSRKQSNIGFIHINRQVFYFF